MVGGDFANDYAANSGKGWRQFALWSCLWTGAGVMAVIGIWL